MKQNEIYVKLRIVEFDCDPEDITIDLRTQPTRTWLKGELSTPKGGVRLKFNGWELSSGVDKHAGFRDHMQALLDMIEPNMERFEHVGAQYYVELACAVYIYYDTEESTPPVNFNRKEMQMLSRIGAEPHFDIYTLPSKSED